MDQPAIPDIVKRCDELLSPEERARIQGELDRRHDELLEVLATPPYNAIPDYMHEGILRFVLLGGGVGDFLVAVFSNDLKAAAVRADDNNRHALWAYGGLLYDHIPMYAAGSREAMIWWHELGGFRGLFTCQLKEGELSDADRSALVRAN